jgi:nicotinate phosphoribosyltransferase
MSPWVDDANASLLTDLYELTMAGAYHAESLDAEATFELWARTQPEHRAFFVVAGIEDAVRYLEEFRFDDDAIAYLRGLDRFGEPFLESLQHLRFTGDMWAMPEGTIAFAGEPLVRITAPLGQAQLVETFLLNVVGFQTMIASKAARVTIAAGGRAWADFGARRAHAADAALKGARAAYVGGASSTSLVLTGREYGIPVTGTMAHSYVLAHDSELDAFVAYARTYPNDAVLLVDTFDTVRGVEIAVEAARIVADEGIEIRGIRLDSGDLAELAKASREILDEAGLEDVAIIASGGLDEHRVADLLSRGAPIDAFGVGTRVLTSEDDPNIDVVYKLVRDETGPRLKTSTGKATLPDVKQVYRFTDDGSPVRDVIALAGEPEPDGASPLLVPMVERGRRLVEAEPLAEIRDRVIADVAALPVHLRSLDPVLTPYPVEVSAELVALTERLTEAT